MIRKFIYKEKSLFYLFLFSIIVIVTRLVFITTNEIFPFASEIGRIFSNLCEGYIISYIFYFIVVFLKGQKDKKNVSEYIVSRLSTIVINGYRLYWTLKTNAHTPKLPFPASEEELSLIFKKLDPVYSNCGKGNGRKYNWLAYFKFVIAEDALAYIDQIWKLLPYLDTELIRILNSLKDSNMFHAAFGVSREIIPLDESFINVHNDKSVHKRVSEYFTIINNIENYLNENFSDYEEFSKRRKDELYRT